MSTQTVYGCRCTINLWTPAQVHQAAWQFVDAPISRTKDRLVLNQFATKKTRASFLS